jgi:hypothetical protein
MAGLGLLCWGNSRSPFPLPLWENESELTEAAAVSQRSRETGILLFEQSEHNTAPRLKPWHLRGCFAALLCCKSSTDFPSPPAFCAAPGSNVCFSRPRHIYPGRARHCEVSMAEAIHLPAKGIEREFPKGKKLLGVLRCAGRQSIPQILSVF